MKIVKTDRPVILISAIDAFAITVADKKGSKDPTPVDCYLAIDGYVSSVADLEPGIDLGKDVGAIGSIYLRIAYIDRENNTIEKSIEVGSISESGFVPTAKAIATLGLGKISEITKQVRKSWDLSARMESAIVKAETKKQRDRQKRANAIDASSLF
jgi:hypothetical protein